MQAQSLHLHELELPPPCSAFIRRSESPSHGKGLKKCTQSCRASSLAEFSSAEASHHPKWGSAMRSNSRSRARAPDARAPGRGNARRARARSAPTVALGLLAALVSASCGGCGGAEGGAAEFDYPRGVAVDGSGNVYVADTLNSTIRKVSPEGVVTTLAGMAESAGSADGTGAAARFNPPTAWRWIGAGTSTSPTRATTRSGRCRRREW